MQKLILDVSDNKNMKKVITNLLTSNEEFYKFSVSLATMYNNASEIETEEFEIFTNLLYSNYYEDEFNMGELMYMIQYAIDDITNDYLDNIFN